MVITDCIMMNVRALMHRLLQEYGIKPQAVFFPDKPDLETNRIVKAGK